MIAVIQSVGKKLGCNIDAKCNVQSFDSSQLYLMWNIIAICLFAELLAFKVSTLYYKCMLIISVWAYFLDFLVDDHLSYCVSDHFVVHQGLSLMQIDLTGNPKNRCRSILIELDRVNFGVLNTIIIQLSYTVWIPVFWLADLYYVILGCDKTTTLTWLSWCKFNTPLSLCSSRKYPYSSHGRDWKVLGGGGFSEAQKSK